MLDLFREITAMIAVCYWICSLLDMTSKYLAFRLRLTDCPFSDVPIVAKITFLIFPDSHWLIVTNVLLKRVRLFLLVSAKKNRLVLIHPRVVPLRSRRLFLYSGPLSVVQYWFFNACILQSRSLTQIRQLAALSSEVRVYDLWDNLHGRGIYFFRYQQERPCGDVARRYR